MQKSHNEMKIYFTSYRAANAEKHALHEALNVRISASATVSSASIESETIQKLRNENVSVKRELLQKSIEIDLVSLD